jgi:hypothetical protein
MGNFILGLLIGVVITYCYYYIKNRIIRCWECDKRFWHTNIEYDYDGVPYCLECKKKIYNEVYKE